MRRGVFFLVAILLLPQDIHADDHIQKIVERLASRSFAEREKAANELSQMGMKALPELRAGVNHSNAEIQKRCRKLVEDLQASGQRRVEEFLRAKNAGGGRLAPVTETALGDVLPSSLVYTLVYPAFPVARIAPPGFGSQNILVVGADGAPTVLKSARELEDFAGKFFRRADNDATMKTFTLAYLRLTQEFSQDGFFKFTIAANEVKKTNDGFSGRVGVDPAGGNKGEILVSLRFDNGRLKSVTEKRSVVAGIRPICQATKLLDPDPIVRTMAEQSLRVLGSLAKPYLDEQRAKASPELQRAIDRLWERIQAEGR